MTWRVLYITLALNGTLMAGLSCSTSLTLDVADCFQASCDSFFQASPSPSPSTFPAQTPPTTHALLKYQFSLHSRALNVAHVNAQSLFAHIDDFRDIFHNAGCHLILTSETWLAPTLCKALINLPDYTFFRNDRAGKRCGGVVIYVRNDIKARVLSSSPNEYQARLSYADHVEPILAPHTALYDHVVFMGDLNTDLFKSSNQSFSLWGMF
ncbi:hypothetical protein PR048_024612 [Dryococelus australis]|uniref:Endonuclease/exonuclease/phosphatase domain-containing protein n=1 Tax=Dryococelus australis TaxID=614101 RepID=A0ABQ9GP40_9NEOP|nr:hypothetical protein PR048_024612 [Dryococelus australis]